VHAEAVLPVQELAELDAAWERGFERRDASTWCTTDLEGKFWLVEVKVVKLSTGTRATHKFG